jgi:peptide/nickel transport system permease protein
MGYAARRLVLIVPTLFGVSVLAFGLASFTPGDPATSYLHRVEDNASPTPQDVASVRRELGLDRPVTVRYVAWAAHAASGDLGRSLDNRRPVAAELAHRIPYTLQLAAPAALLAVVIAVPAGILSARYRGRTVDHLARMVALAGASVPGFWLAYLLIGLASVRLRLLPSGGRAGWSSAVLPVVTLAVAPAATLARFTRSIVLESLGDPHVLTARAKGLPEWRIVGWHAFRPALAPLITAIGLSTGFLMSGAVIVESIFAWPGVGLLTLTAIRQGDTPTIQAVVLYTGLTFALINLLVDLSYALVDARLTTTPRRQRMV